MCVISVLVLLDCFTLETEHEPLPMIVLDLVSTTSKMTENRHNWVRTQV